MTVHPLDLDSRVTSPTSILQYLSRHRMFGALGDSTLRKLASEVIERTYPKYHRLYYKDEPTTHVYVVEKGLVVNVVDREDGRLYVRQVCYSGGVLSSSTAVLSRPHVGTAFALTDSVILLIPRDAFDSLWRTSPDMAYQIIQDMYWKLRHAEQKEVNAHAKGSIARVAELLLSIVSKIGTPGEEQAALEVGLAQEDLALLMGSTRETVSRALCCLARMKVIAVGRRRVTILKPASLAELARGKPRVELSDPVTSWSEPQLDIYGQ